MIFISDNKNYSNELKSMDSKSEILIFSDLGIIESEGIISYPGDWWYNHL
tara:strand:- start:453 stop:602 length:150 start_codon:yes stop_codon:yes gene_type:complete